MDGNNHEAPGLAALAKKAARTALGALGNRGELLAVELQEEKARLLELMIWGVAILFFGMMTAIFLTAVIILLFAPENRVYVAGAFTLLYLIGTILAAGSLRSLLKHEPFAESIEQVRKDRVWLESFK